MSQVIQLISHNGDIYHKFLGSPRHTRLDMGYTRVHHDYQGGLSPAEFCEQLTIGLGKRALCNNEYANAQLFFEQIIDNPTSTLIAVEEATYWCRVASSNGAYDEDKFTLKTTNETTLAGVVEKFCGLLIRIPDDELMLDWKGVAGNGSWSHYTDCLREVILGIYQGLMDTAFEIEAYRISNGHGTTKVQRILGAWHKSYRQFRGIVFGLNGHDIDKQHLDMNYSLGKQRTIRNNIVHCIMAEFWAHGTAIRNAVQALKGQWERQEYPIQATCDKFGMPPGNYGTLEEILGISEERHNQLIQEFSSISDEVLDTGFSWWEDSDVTIRFRLNRMSWHLQDHAAVIETICERIGRKRSETERLVMRLYHALGHVEASLIGLSSLDLDRHVLIIKDMIESRSKELMSIYITEPYDDEPKL
ncbi:MAG: DinB family protein [Flavobacterium sp. JAD_PAG50586_2]|nr:MAG: DinB family protein [Flavobacterium sp. JAD_PAG50586_2]